MTLTANERELIKEAKWFSSATYGSQAFGEEGEPLVLACPAMLVAQERGAVFTLGVGGHYYPKMGTPAGNPGQDGEIAFRATVDVAEALGYRNTWMYLQALVHKKEKIFDRLDRREG